MNTELFELYVQNETPVVSLNAKFCGMRNCLECKIREECDKSYLTIYDVIDSITITYKDMHYIREHYPEYMI